MERPKLHSFLPHLFTLGSVFCGLYSILMSARLGEAGQADPDLVYRAALAIALGLLLDGIDGRVARWTGTASRLGAQLDSLADLITFGVAPAVLVYRFALEPLGAAGVSICFAFVASGAWRLARYNVEAMEQHDEPAAARVYHGLPIPVAGNVVMAAVLACQIFGVGLAATQWLLAATCALASAMMVSRMRFPA